MHLIVDYAMSMSSNPDLAPCHAVVLILVQCLRAEIITSDNLQSKPSSAILQTM